MRESIDWRSIGFPGLPEQLPEYEKINEWCQEYLASLPGGVALEIGTWHGRATALLAQYFRTVITIDTFDTDNFVDRITRGQAQSWRAFHANMARLGLEDRIITICGSSEQLGMLPYLDAGMVLVDGDHSKEWCIADISRATDHLRPGGLIVVHDYKRGRYSPDPWRGVAEAVDTILRGEIEDIPPLEVYDCISGVIALQVKA